MENTFFMGVGAALPTPFDATESVDYPALKKLINRLINQRIDFLVPCGTTGESPTLSHEEHKQIIDFTIKVTEKRVPVLAGTGSNNTREAIELTEVALKSGAEGVLSIAPYYSKPMSQGFLNHFREIAKVGLPIMLYDIPGRTAKGVPLEVIIELALEEAIFGLKWASGDFNQLMALRHELSSDFTILSGDDALTLPAMALGAKGVISVVANLTPQKIKIMCDILLNNDLIIAEQIHYKLLPLFKALFIETNPIPLKEALSLVYPDFLPILRSPMSRMEEKNLFKLKEVLRDCELLD